MYKKIIFLAVIMLSAVITFAQPSQYTPMTAQGYQFKRILCDSTLHLPSFCGVPNLRNSTAKNGALAIDTCNNRLYQWTRSSGWSIVGGTTIDTTSLSNRINTKIDSLKRSTDSIFARVNGVWKFQYKDSIGGTTIDTTSLSNRINTKIDSLKRSTDSIFARVNGVWRFQYKDSIGGSTPSLQAVTDVGATTTNMITASTNYATTEFNKIDVSNQVYYPFYATDGDLLFPNESYIRMGNFGGLEPEFYNGTTQAGGAYNRLTPTYLEFNDDNISVNLRKPSTASADDHYLPISDNTTDTLATTSQVALKLNISDTTNKWVTSVTKLNDSTIRVVKNTTTTDITLTPAATVTAATRLVTSVYNNSGSTITKGSVVYINGRHSSNLPTIALAQANTEGNSYSTFALVQDDIPTSNSGIAIQAGNIGNLNLPTSSYTDGEVIYLSPTIAGGLTTNKTSVLAPNHIVKIGTITRAHPTAGSIEIKIENGWQMDELSDVQISSVPNDSTLLQFSRVDSLWHSVSVNNAIGTKYIKPSDTASMLTPYLRKVDTTAKFVNNITRTAGKDSIIFFIGGTRYAIKDSVGGGGGTSYTFSTGLTNTSGTITNNLSTGVAGGQSVVGGTASGNSLTLSSTSNATKGKLLFGTSAYDEVNNRLGIGTASPTELLQLNGTSTQTPQIFFNANGASSNDQGLYFGFSGNKKIGFGYTQNGGNRFYIYNIVAGGNDALRIYESSNNIAINSTSDAGFKFDVNGTARAVTSLQTPTLLGNTTSGGTLTLQSTSNATKGKILFGTSAYDEVNNRLGIGTASPTYSLDVNSGRARIAGNNGIVGTIGGTNYGLSVQNNSTASWIEILNNGGANKGAFFGVNSNNFELWNYQGGNIDFYTDVTATSGLIRMTIKNNGNIVFPATNTAAGTTGNQTINKTSGTVNIAAAGTSITVTNSLVTTSSIVFATIRTNDATAVIKNVVPAAGSFTINLNAAATAETSIGFFVIN